MAACFLYTNTCSLKNIIKSSHLKIWEVRPDHVLRKMSKKAIGTCCAGWQILIFHEWLPCHACVPKWKLPLLYCCCFEIGNDHEVSLNLNTTFFTIVLIRHSQKYLSTLDHLNDWCQFPIESGPIVMILVMLVFRFFGISVLSYVERMASL